MARGINSSIIAALGAFVFMYSCTSETRKTDVSTEILKQEADSVDLFIMDEEIYDIVNELLAELPGGFDSNIIVNQVLTTTFDDAGFYFQPKIEKNPSTTKKGIGQFFGTKMDSVFIQKQLKTHQGKFWIPGKYRGISENDELLSRYESNGNFDWDQFNKDGFGCFESYGIPLFNVDSTRCSLKISGVCNGSIGFSSTLLFERKRGIWDYVGEMKD